MAPGKKTLGVGAVISAMLKFVHPSVPESQESSDAGWLSHFEAGGQMNFL